MLSIYTQYRPIINVIHVCIGAYYTDTPLLQKTPWIFLTWNHLRRSGQHLCLQQGNWRDHKLKWLATTGFILSTLYCIFLVHYTVFYKILVCEVLAICLSICISNRIILIWNSKLNDLETASVHSNNTHPNIQCSVCTWFWTFVTCTVCLTGYMITWQGSLSFWMKPHGHTQSDSQTHTFSCQAGGERTAF